MSERAPARPSDTAQDDPGQRPGSRQTSRLPEQCLSESTSRDPHHKPQSEVMIIRGMPSSSPSVSSADTRSSSRYEGVTVHARAESGTGSEGTGRSAGAEPAVLSHASSSSSSSLSSSWDTASSKAPFASVGLESPRRIYACLFHMLDCHESFDDAVQWRTHVRSHFRMHQPPSTARCPLCPSTKFIDGVANPVSSPVLEGTKSVQDSDPVAVALPPGQSSQSSQSGKPAAWDRMLDHVATTHYEQGHTLARSRPDFELMRYLYGLRIISDAQFKVLQLPPAPSSPAYHRSQDGVRASIGSADEPYCAPYSRRREERMRGQQRGVSVV
ncbi:hypothetical protein NUU61_010170 [Penicillium alfredii]|uniref:Uncharacterized protein n=1 Tax=Penicillium alfredii TaxID=1506179 RepID=A0A9W9EHH9_9EURO|nr:uncharacterized protein NUU61_010170 [Penicillium alfredii]KAJ5081906.1 hypothetical protein NUU61_010170 [Penicillium alfredii]